MSCKRILVRRQRGLMNGLWQEGRFLELECVSDQPEGARLNQIRTAKVKNIVKNINAAFLELGGSQAAYYDPVSYTHLITRYTERYTDSQTVRLLTRIISAIIQHSSIITAMTIRAARFC